MKTFKQLVSENMARKSDQDRTRIKALWNDFLVKARKSGYVPKARTTITMHDINKTPNDVSGDVHLKTDKYIVQNKKRYSGE